jgi:hypothetical protein
VEFSLNIGSEVLNKAYDHRGVILEWTRHAISGQHSWLTVDISQMEILYRIHTLLHRAKVFVLYCTELPTFSHLFVPNVGYPAEA